MENVSFIQLQSMINDKNIFKEISNDVTKARTSTDVEYVKGVIAHISKVLNESESYKDTYRSYLFELNDLIVNFPIDKEFQQLKSAVENALSSDDWFLVDKVRPSVRKFMGKTKKYDKECREFLKQIEDRLYELGLD